MAPRRSGERARPATPTALAAAGLLATGLSLAAAGAAQAAGTPFASLPSFTGLSDPTDIAVDAAGDVFVADTGNNDVVEMPADATSASQQVTLPFTGLSGPQGVAVDAKGDVYVADTGNDRVVELPAGSSQQVTLPFIPATDDPSVGLYDPVSVGVDAAGDVFVLNQEYVAPPAVIANADVLELEAGSDTERTVQVPVGEMAQLPVMTVDAAGDVFVGGNPEVTDNDQALMRSLRWPRWQPTLAPRTSSTKAPMGTTPKS